METGITVTKVDISWYPPEILVVYVAGPFTANTPWLIENNVRRAEEASLKVCALRHNLVALCPHTMFRFFHGLTSDHLEAPQYWYNATLGLLRVSHAILMMNGWEKSTGATNEHAEAGRLGMPIFFEDNLWELQQWAKRYDKNEVTSEQQKVSI